MSLRQRCEKALDNIETVEDLMEFVIAETGRKAAPVLDETYPLCLYFESSAEREDFIRMTKQINPSMKASKVQ